MNNDTVANNRIKILNIHGKSLRSTARNLLQNYITYCGCTCDISMLYL